VGARAALVQRVIDEIFRRPWFTINPQDCMRLFGISVEICARILHELERTGIVRETRPGTWTRRSFA
jgi:ribosomal protein S25